MYPNPQSVLPLPQHPDLDQYRKRAKELAQACREGSDAISAWAAEWVAALLDRAGEAPDASRRAVDREGRQIADYARDRLIPADCALSQAQFVIARAHGFASWPKFVHHIEAITAGESDLSAFERAADAIVEGDLETVDRLLATRRDLVRARSDREHQATLLHYVSANGVENYRQKTAARLSTTCSTTASSRASGIPRTAARRCTSQRIWAMPRSWICCCAAVPRSTYATTCTRRRRSSGPFRPGSSNTVTLPSRTRRSSEPWRRLMRR